MRDLGLIWLDTKNRKCNRRLVKPEENFEDAVTAFESLTSTDLSNGAIVEEKLAF